MRVILLVVLVLAGCSSPPPTATPTPSPTATPTPTATPAPTATATPAPAPTATPNPLEIALAAVDTLKRSLAKVESVQDVDFLQHELSRKRVGLDQILCDIADGRLEPVLYLNDLTDDRTVQLGIKTRLCRGVSVPGVERPHYRADYYKDYLPTPTPTPTQENLVDSLTGADREIAVFIAEAWAATNPDQIASIITQALLASPEFEERIPAFLHLELGEILKVSIEDDLGSSISLSLDSIAYYGGAVVSVTLLAEGMTEVDTRLVESIGLSIPIVVSVDLDNELAYEWNVDLDAVTVVLS